MTFKAILQVLRGGGAKIYRCYNQILAFFISKNVTKFACLQTLKVTCTYA